MTASSRPPWFLRHRIAIFVAVTALFVGGIVWYSRPRPLLSENDPPDLTYQKITEAYGGTEALDRWRSGRLDYEVDFDFPGVGKWHTRFREAFQLPGKLRREMQMTLLGETGTSLFVADGESMWVDKEGRIIQMENNPYKKAGCVEVVRGFHPAYLFDGGTRLVVQGTARRDDSGRDLILEIPSEGRTSNECRVDMRTGLIQEYTGPIPVPLGPELATVRFIYSDYRNTPGGPVPFRMIGYQDGHKVIDLRLTSVDLDTPAELALFTPPNRP